MATALAGIKILDLTTVLMGPSAAQMLGDMGADVIKIEPLSGDTTRNNGYARTPGMSGWFLNLNRSKRSLAIDAKSPAGRGALLRLAETADVMLYNIRPAAMARLGLSYDVISEINPRLVYVGALGFGLKGEYANLPAYDELIQAATGLPWLYKLAGSDEPRFVPTPIVDRLMSAHVAMNILGGLHSRARTGRGQRIDVPMFETMASVMLGDQLCGLTFEPPLGPSGYTRMLLPDRKPYATQDGFIAALPTRDDQWRNFFKEVGALHLYEDDERFSTDVSRQKHLNDLYVTVAGIISEKTTSEWLALFKRLDIAAMPVNSIEDMVISKQLEDGGFFHFIEHPTEGVIRQMQPAASWSDTPLTSSRPAPNLGEHSCEVLQEVGYTQDEVNSLLERNVIKQWKHTPTHISTNEK